MTTAKDVLGDKDGNGGFVESFADLGNIYDVRFAEFKLPTGQTMRFGSLSAGDLMEFIEGNKDQNLSKTSGLRMVIKSAVDRQGNRIGNVERDLPVLLSKDAQSVQGMVGTVMKLNGLSKQAQELLKNVLSEVTSGASLSGSQPS